MITMTKHPAQVSLLVPFICLQDVDKQAAVPFIKASAAMRQNGKRIPEFMQLPPTTEQQQLEAYRSKLMNILQPTPETMAAVGKDTALMSGAHHSTRYKDRT